MYCVRFSRVALYTGPCRSCYPHPPAILVKSESASDALIFERQSAKKNKNDSSCPRSAKYFYMCTCFVTLLRVVLHSTLKSHSPPRIPILPITSLHQFCTRPNRNRTGPTLPKVLSRDYLNAFSQHLSSMIPFLLSLAEGDGCGGRSDRNGKHCGKHWRRLERREAQGEGGKDRRAPDDKAEVGAMSRFRAVQCLTTITALPYSRLHPFKAQVRGKKRDFFFYFVPWWTQGSTVTKQNKIVRFRPLRVFARVRYFVRIVNCVTSQYQADFSPCCRSRLKSGPLQSGAPLSSIFRTAFRVMEHVDIFL